MGLGMGIISLRGWKAHADIFLFLFLAALVHATEPNIVFIMTDDQDTHMESMKYMPLVQKHLTDQGTQYNNHFCTVSVCCPSRVSLLTGKAAHNTNVTDVKPPYGGYPKFVEEGHNDNYLPIWLQDAGYNTYYTGKLMNAHTVDNYNAPHAAGFTGSDFLLDPYTYFYYNATMTRNGEPPVNYEGQYSNDVVAEKAYGFLEEAAQLPEPFFLAIAPIGPHTEVSLVDITMPQYPPRHADLFTDYKIPRDANFNPGKPSGVSWVSTLPPLSDTVIDYNDEFQRARLRSLQSIDEMVEEVVRILEEKDVLHETYIFFTTDNGFHLSQHRMIAGKQCGYETDVHIPLVVRGPSIAAGGAIDVPTSHTNIAPTIMSIIGHARDDFDALPLPLSATEATPESYESIGIEFWGVTIPEGKHNYEGKDPLEPQSENTYKALRLIGEGYNLYYSVWCTNEKEYYDMTTDPGQLTNMAADTSLYPDYQIGNRPLQQVINRLDALMLVVKSCKTSECIEPWKVLHPQGDVLTLTDALQEQFDTFYDDQPNVSFSSCELGYIIDAEGPQQAIIYE